MGTEREISATCGSFRRELYHFQADELPEAQRRVLEVHLDACRACARRLELEDGLLRGLKRRLARHAPPADLETRVRGLLPGAARPASGARSPWLIAVAASLSLAALALTVLRTLPPAGRISPLGVVTIDREATLVDRECDRAGRDFTSQRECRDPAHVNVLKLEDGRYWTIHLDTTEAVVLSRERLMRGHRLAVRGDLYPGIDTLRLERFRDLGLIVESARPLGPAAGFVLR